MSVPSQEQIDRWHEDIDAMLNEEDKALYKRFCSELGGLVRELAEQRTEAELADDDDYRSVDEMVAQFDKFVLKARELQPFLDDTDAAL